MTARKTRQKDLILTVLQGSPIPQSVDYIYAKLAGKMAQSTIYRNINAMVERDEADRYFISGNKMLYRVKDGAHNHYIVCDRCGKIAPIPSCNIAPLEKKAERETGFTIKNHYLQMSGTCKKCNRKAK